MNPKMKDRAMFALGVAICFAVAGLSVLLEELIPGHLLGASIIALFTGTIINSFFHPAWMKPALKFTSKKILKAAIILLGASLSVSTILSVGKMTFFVMIFTFAMCFGGGYFVRKIFGLNWKLGNLISAGTGICGGSAIAAIAPVIDADDKDIAFAMSSTFLFDMVMIALYPLMGKALGMSDIAYGIWAGTSVNDTASVVASGYAFSEAAGDFATMVKLTRTIA
ncbi:MAG: putative sulfate exporter family transporter, partial [Oscillospiraceae bacterium]|nr:putative sulfate exporter family transporter [Oscillospiraceae bacterium]